MKKYLNFVLIMSALSSMQVFASLGRFARFGQTIKSTLMPRVQRLAQIPISHRLKNVTWNKVGAVATGVAFGCMSKQCYRTAKAEQLSERERFQEKPAILAEKAKNKQEIYKNYLLNTPWKKTAQKELDQLDQEEKELIKEFLNLSRLSYKEFNLYSAVFFLKERDRVDSESLKYPLANNEIRQKIQQLATKIGISDSIVVLEEKHLANAYVKFPYVYVDSNYLRNMSPEVLDYAILHELAHYSCDSLQSAFIINYVNEHMRGFNSLQWYNYGVKYSHFVEKRADIFAGLCDYGRSYDACVEFQEMGEKEYDGYVAANSHPSNFDRSDYLEALHDAMLDEVIDNQTHI